MYNKKRGDILENLAAVIFDVVNSKEDDAVRYEMQNVIKKAVTTLNKIYKKNIKIEVIFGAGDECQGLFYDVYSAYQYIVLLQKLINPIKIRCGIGVGSILYFDKKFTSTETDGESYRRAREAIDASKIKPATSIVINSNDNYCMALNVLFHQLHNINNSFTNLTNEIDLVLSLIAPINEFDLNENEKKLIIDFLGEKRKFIITKRERDTFHLYGKYKSKNSNNDVVYKDIITDLKVLKNNICNKEFINNVETLRVNTWYRNLSISVSKIIEINQASISDSKKNINAKRDLELSLSIILKERFK